MASVFDEVVAQARQLPQSERLRLVEQLLRDLEPMPTQRAAEVAAAWEAEIERRLDDLEAGGVVWVLHEQVIAEAHAAVRAAARGA